MAFKTNAKLFQRDCQHLDIDFGAVIEFSDDKNATEEQKEQVAKIAEAAAQTMNGDPHQGRFMGYLSLFTFFMLVLVTADNYLIMFLG